MFKKKKKKRETVPGLDKNEISKHYNSGAPRAPLARVQSTIAKKILVTHQCERSWFYSHDVIDPS